MAVSKLIRSNHLGVDFVVRRLISRLIVCLGMFAILAGCVFSNGTIVTAQSGGPGQGGAVAEAQVAPLSITLPSVSILAPTA
jgi:hypothetical protein